MTWKLPEAWGWRLVSEVLTPVKAQAKPDEIHDDWLYVGLEHVQSATGEYTGVEAGTADIKSNKFRFEAGDVLYGKLRPNLRKCVVATSAGVCSTDLVPLRPVAPEAAHFLAMQLRSEPFTASVMRLIGGANLPRVNIKDLFTLALPAPPPGEETRLFEMAESASSLRAALRALEATVTEVDRAAVAAVLGLASPEEPTLRAVATPVP